ncbi:transporter substrate-binding domain-containing protein [Roseomonas stagni]|uniref:Transporter substrate-binding domain-containing protein n=1 Tax=Falsiroseomonas algicola TaxID=2716930 RepID=A0A6M1LIG9_9PROT|nr:transporter substrate-binding domain-containing protein [Falsiroseomonas algicola]NGM20138.1 transporter substrate-binding domain-containing protein [Falsiroseomonas algicola]
MRKLIAALVLALPMAAAAQSPTLDAVRARGEVTCAIHTGLPGFAMAGPDGRVAGIDADTCRAVAAAVLGDAGKVRFVPGSMADSLAATAAGRVDMMARAATQTMLRDTALGLAAAGVTVFDGQGFVVRRASGIADVSGLAGRTVCVTAGSTNELSLADAARRTGISVTALPLPTVDALLTAYGEGRCEALSADMVPLAGLVATRFGTAEHVVLPDVISREPLGPFVRDGDRGWEQIAFWTVNALTEAEALGITAANAAGLRESGSPRLRRLLGGLPGIGAPLGLADDWVFRVVTQVGNYAEVYERNLGAGSPIGLARGLNQLYDRGGLLYPIPMR